MTWNRENAAGKSIGDTPLSWSVAALEDTNNRLCKGNTLTLPEALAVIGEAVWWTTLVDATMIRYHHDVYDRTLSRLSPAERRTLEGTFTGLRFVRNTMGYYVHPADFIQPQPGRYGGDAPVSAWTWRSVDAPTSIPLARRAKAWQAGRHLQYRACLANRTVAETFDRTTVFLTQLIPIPD